jgi:RNA polymerase sigma factor (sigma-70 family)
VVDELALLVQQAQAGDPEAFSRIVDRLQDLAYGAARAHLGHHDMAQDAAQEAFVEAFLHLPSLREPAAFSGWFRQILFRRCVRLLRRKAVSTLPLESALEVPCGRPGPQQAAEVGELRLRVREAVASLPEHERMVTQLFYISGYSHREISEFLDVPVTSIKKRLHSARNRLKRRMLALVEEELQAERPSRSGLFAAEVELRAAAARGDARRTEEILRCWPELGARTGCRRT